MGPVPESTVSDGNRADPSVETDRRGASQEDLAVAAEWLRGVSVRMRIAPRPVLPRDRQFFLDGLVVGAKVPIGDRPVGTDPLGRRGVEVRGVKAGRVPGVVDHGPTHSPTGIVRSERHRVGTADHSGFGPVQAVRTSFVADPIGVRVPEWSGIQPDDAPSRPSQALHQRCATGTAPDDHNVDLVVVGEITHVGSQPVVGAIVAVGDQPRRFVPCPDTQVTEPVHWALRSVPVIPACRFLALSTRGANVTGSAL